VAAAESLAHAGGGGGGVVEVERGRQSPAGVLREGALVEVEGTAVGARRPSGEGRGSTV